MMYKHLPYKNVIIFLFLFAIIFWEYRFLFGSYFQQDEWISLGQVLGAGPFAGLHQYPFSYYLAGYVRFPGTLMNNIIHYTFPFNPQPFAVLGIIFHNINAFLVYIFAYLLTKKRFVAIVAGIFFAVSTVHHQAISWFSSTTTTLPSVGFSLLSLIFVFVGVQHKSTRNVYVGQFFLFLSFLHKESTICLFPLLLLVFFLGKETYALKGKKMLIVFFPTIGYLLYILLVRFWLFYTPEGGLPIYVTSEKHGALLLLKQAVVYPFIGFSQAFIPSQFITSLAVWSKDIFSLNIYSRMSIEVALSILITCIFFVVFSILYVFKKNFQLAILVGSAMVLLSFVPLAVMKWPQSAYFESRYYYLATVGAAILLGIFVSSCCRVYSWRKQKIGLLFCGSFSLILFYFFYKNISLTRAYILQQNIEGYERKNLLTQIKTTYPKIGEGAIFYITGDSIGYYGVAEQKIPFQQGVGFTLMTLYYDTGVIPRELLRDWFLWDIRAEGYRQVGSKSFGYFHSMEGLKQLLEGQKEITPDHIYAFYFYSHGSQRTLMDITQETRDKLKSHLLELHE